MRLSNPTIFLDESEQPVGLRLVAHPKSMHGLCRTPCNKTPPRGCHLDSGLNGGSRLGHRVIL